MTWFDLRVIVDAFLFPVSHFNFYIGRNVQIKIIGTVPIIFIEYLWGGVG